MVPVGVDPPVKFDAIDEKRDVVPLAEVADVAVEEAGDGAGGAGAGGCSSVDS